MSRILIAGCGYVGTALAERLVGAHHDVVALRRTTHSFPRGVTPLVADLTDPRSLDALPSDVDAVVYAASPDERTDAAYRAAYVDGVRNLLGALDARSVHRLVMTSSTGVYAQTDGAWLDEDSPIEPTGFTGRRLLEGEAIVTASPIESVVLRLGGIYGPGRTRLLEQVRRGEATYPPEPRYTNRIHQDDCAGALEHLLRLERTAPVYLGVDDEPADRRTVLEWLAHELGAPAPRMARDTSSRRSTSSKRCRNTRLRDSGYELRYPTFREGYRAILADPT